MTSKAPNVAAYLAEVPAERRAVLEQLRALCRKHLKGYEECMAYGLPSYKRQDVVEIAFASQKHFIAVYVMKKDVMDEFRSALTTASIGKGCIRFTRPEKIDFEVLDRLLRRNAESTADPC